MIELHDVSYRVGGRSLVSDMQLHVRAGEVVAVVGANGAGKTTLLRLLSGELRPSSGTITLDGRALAAYAPDALARRRAVLAQQSSLAFGFSSLEVVLLGRTPHHTSLAENIEIALDAMAMAGVQHLAHQPYPTLSGGEQQRVHLARALAQIGNRASGDGAATPGYLLLDEPTASLDLVHQHGVLGRARELAGAGVGVLAVLHDLNLAAQYADRIVALRQGELVAEGTPRALLSPDLIRATFGVAALVTDHPCLACPLVVTLSDAHGLTLPATADLLISQANPSRS